MIGVVLLTFEEESMGKIIAEKLTIKYSGPDVEDGSMPVEDVLQALQGFSNAYSKISKFKNITTRQQIRLVGLQKGSCDLLISIIDVANQINIVGDQLLAGSLTGGLALQIIKTILSLIKLTKHTQNKAYDIKINGNNNSVTIQNFNNVSLDVPIEVLDLFQNKVVAADLNKITDPLSEGKINEAAIIVQKVDESNIEERINIEEKQFFSVDNIDTTITPETWLQGTINTLTKSTNNGKFILNDGNHVPFHLCMDRPEDYYHFFASKGFVRIRCIAHLDEYLKPIRLDVYDIEEIQYELFKDQKKT